MGDKGQHVDLLLIDPLLKRIIGACRIHKDILYTIVWSKMISFFLRIYEIEETEEKIFWIQHFFRKQQDLSHLKVTQSQSG